MNITVKHEPTTHNPIFTGTGTLIPIGGGKDSCVTLELLKHQDNNSCFIINPKPVTLECARLANYDSNNTITPLRRIDKNLLELNKEGFLNGHTPFSSMVAFLSYLTAYLYDKKYIALSNESSAMNQMLKEQKLIINILKHTNLNLTLTTIQKNSSTLKLNTSHYYVHYLNIKSECYFQNMINIIQYSKVVT